MRASPPNPGVPRRGPAATAPAGRSAVEPPASLDPAASVDDLVAGLIAAHDLASVSGPDGSEGGIAVQVQLERTLRSAGVDRMLVAVGDPFNPHFHQVAATEPAPEPGLNHRIAREVRAGWYSATGVLRPAEVIVWTG